MSEGEVIFEIRVIAREEYAMKIARVISSCLRELGARCFYLRDYPSRKSPYRRLIYMKFRVSRSDLERW